MRAVIVGGPCSEWHGATARCCGQKVRAGQAVLVTKLRGMQKFTEKRFVLHVDHLQAMIDAAPAGTPVRSGAKVDEEFRQIRDHQLALAAGREG